MDCPHARSRQRLLGLREALVDKEDGMKTNNGWTALMHAVFCGHLECVELLMDKEKGMQTTREWFGFPPGTTALDIARRHGHDAIASLLE